MRGGERGPLLRERWAGDPWRHALVHLIRGEVDPDWDVGDPETAGRFQPVVAVNEIEGGVGLIRPAELDHEGRHVLRGLPERVHQGTDPGLLEALGRHDLVDRGMLQARQTAARLAAREVARRGDCGVPLKDVGLGG